MALNKKYSYVWHVGETATPFTWQMKDSNGDARTDVASATFTLVSREDGEVIVNAAACQSVAAGLLSYTPAAEDMETACRFLAQFTATLDDDDDSVLPTVLIEGEIEASL
jgi:hypothetical protein